MTTQEANPSMTVTKRPTLWDLVVRGVAWALVAVGLAVLVAIVVSGEREASYADLRAAVADGRVDEVRVEGGLSDDQAIGSAGAVVHWRDGLARHVTSVTEASSPREGRGADGGLPIVEGLVDDELTQLSPDLRTSRADERWSYSNIGPWRVPSWTRPTMALMYIVIIGLIIGGPTPWRATRWAWFWLLSVAPPLGGLAFLLLGGSTGVLRPARPEKRLTGGIAFLLSIVAGMALAVVGSAIL